MSTAKSKAIQYLNGKGSTLNAGGLSQLQRFKSSAGNLTSDRTDSRLKSTSMTSLVSEQDQMTRGIGGRIQRPASRNALDSIHNGMNAKYAQVQSKVYLQNIRPQAGKAATPTGTIAKRTPNKLPVSSIGKSAVSERNALLSKLKVLQEQLEVAEHERDQLKQELERERADKLEQVQQLKLELQEKLAEHEKQAEDYHQKLLEAYELADQNRRAADSALSESRQKDEENRKKIEELEGQLGELKEFVSMKEEMNGKMYELREQIREERERYEDQLKSLHQLFENEKMSSHLFEEQRISSSINLNAIKIDHNSNYFNRIKPVMESSESINKSGKISCRKCASSSSKLHRSEHDIYGSKLSTRMHDTARSAWKASKHFASSVITGGVSLSGCRKRSSGSSKANTSEVPLPSPRLVLKRHQEEEEEACRVEAQGEQREQHTSIVQVDSALKLADQQPVNDHQRAKTSGSVIRVDENNKLTIVTKFNEQSERAASSIEMGASSNVSERSRCESSSSGRGTASDAGSSLSQNGDEEPVAKQTPEPDLPLKRPDRHHKRKSSLSKVFGGSQVSVNKLKSLFSRKSSIELNQDKPVCSVVAESDNQSSSVEAAKVDAGSQVGQGACGAIELKVSGHQPAMIQQTVG